MRSEIHGFTKNLHLYWTIWSIIMMKDNLAKGDLEANMPFLVPFAEFRLQ